MGKSSKIIQEKIQKKAIQLLINGTKLEVLLNTDNECYKFEVKLTTDNWKLK